MGAFTGGVGAVGVIVGSVGIIALPVGNIGFVTVGLPTYFTLRIAFNACLNSDSLIFFNPPAICACLFQNPPDKSLLIFPANFEEIGIFAVSIIAGVNFVPVSFTSC